MALPEIDPMKVFGTAFGVSSFAGLASLLRSGKQLSVASVLSAMINSGLVGLTIALLWYNKFRAEDNVYFLIGVCVLAGLGGTTALDFVIQLCKKGGLHVTISPKSDDDVPDK